MGYEDNPRKVYGRVDVVYSDSEISTDIVAGTNGDSEISHPSEVYQGFQSPTVKACTMDGNSVMDGSFQMLGESCVLGWWSKALCDENGEFTDVKPYIELSFVQRPIITWSVLGDIKLNQYPVDFTVEYKNNGNTLKTEKFEGNTQLEVKFEPKIEDITSIRMTILKWSRPNACVKILRFYDRMFERYEGDALQMFEVNEEMSPAEGNYNINSDTMTVTLYNLDRKFDRGYLRSLMILDRKITPSIGVEKDGRIEYTKLGTFYSDEWQLAEDSQWVKCTAVDKLLRLQTKNYVGFPLLPDVSLYELAADVFQKLGYTSSEYRISDSLKDIVVPNAYLPKMTTWDALQEIANAGLCHVYIDREDRINIRAESEKHPESGIELNGGNSFGSTSNITLTEFANEIEVEYSEVTVSEDIIETAEVEIALDAREELRLTMDYTSEICDAWIESDNPVVRLTGFQSGVNAGEVLAINTTDQTAMLTVTGNAIVVNSRSITARDEDSIRNFGVTEYKHTASELVQSAEHARYIASVLLRAMHAGEGVVTVTWRGNPALQLGGEYDYIDRFGDGKRLVCEYNKISYDGGLKQETRGRKVVKGG